MATPGPVPPVSAGWNRSKSPTGPPHGSTRHLRRPALPEPAFAVSAVFTGNYQRPTAPSPQESSTAGGVANERTAGSEAMPGGPSSHCRKCKGPWDAYLRAKRSAGRSLVDFARIAFFIQICQGAIRCVGGGGRLSRLRTTRKLPPNLLLDAAARSGSSPVGIQPRRRRSKSRPKNPGGNPRSLHNCGGCSGWAVMRRRFEQDAPR